MSQGSLAELRLLGSIALIGLGLAAAPAGSTTRREVAFARLFPSASGIVGIYDVVGCGADCKSYKPHLFRADGSRRWREISPRGLLFQLEDVGFVTRRTGWLVANDCTAAKAFVYRTTDGGSTWRAARITPCNCAAGSRIALSFADANHVWSLTTYVNAPGSVLERSSDGGKTWRRVAVDLPVFGAITFATPRDGWLSRVGVAGAFYVTHDGGRSWRRLTLAAPHGWRGAKLYPDVPAFFGKRGVWPVGMVRGRYATVAFYVTSDGGGTWRPRALHAVQSIRVGAFGSYVPASVVNPSVWWLATGRRHHAVALTTDSGTTWHEAVLPRAARAGGFELSAGSARRAWVTVRNVVYATSDSGRTWQRLALPRG